MTKILRQYNKGLISAYEAYCLMMTSPERGRLTEVEIITALIGRN